MSAKNFLFSSVGDNTNFDSLWISDYMDYDVYVIYYGNDDEIYKRYASKVTFIEKRKGGKFQNFKYFYDKYIHLINRYDRFFLLDDDIIFNVNDINEMFKISRQYNLDICGPSFSEQGKVSHDITLHKPNTLLSYTNFVENNTPLFNIGALHELMKTLDHSLIGWGIDFLYIICNGLEKKDSYAIVHKIVCENPKDSKKGGVREFSKIPNCHTELQMWKQFADIHKLPYTFRMINYENIPM